MKNTKSIKINFTFIIISFLLISINFYSYAINNNEIKKAQDIYLKKLHITEAWKYTKGNKNIIIGIIDKGFDFYHPALKGKLQPGFYANNVFHYQMYSFINQGTISAGIIGAQRTKNYEITGFAPNCSILAASMGEIDHPITRYKNIFNKEINKKSPIEKKINTINNYFDNNKFDRQIWQSYIANSISDSIYFLSKNKVSVILINYTMNLQSFDKDNRNKLINAFEHAYKNNIVIIMGCFMYKTDKEFVYPLDSDSLIITAPVLLNNKTISYNQKYNGINYTVTTSLSKRLTISAPVENIAVLAPYDIACYKWIDGPGGNEDYIYKGPAVINDLSGSSTAAAIVASLAGLVRSIRPDISAKEVIQIIKLGADNINNKGFDEKTGYGMVNFEKTLKIVKNWKKI